MGDLSTNKPRTFKVSLSVLVEGWNPINARERVYSAILSGEPQFKLKLLPGAKSEGLPD